MDIQPAVSPNQKLFDLLAPAADASTSTATTEPTPNPVTKPAPVPITAADTVTLSYRATKMQAIAAEFFGGTIHSSQIPALTQRMYEEGFLSTAEYQNLGGASQKISAVSEASSFINKFIATQLNPEDKEAAKGLLQVAAALAAVNTKPTADTRRLESEAQQFLVKFVKTLEQSGAGQEQITGFNKVVDVFSALEKVRAQENSTGALTGYAQVQEAYDDLLKNN